MSSSDVGARIELRHDGFALRWPDPAAVAAFVGWSDVVRIRTYKRDLFAVDSVCLAFDRGTGGPVEVCEEMSGFDELSACMRERFPDIPADWFGTVVQPPFAANPAVLYESDGPWRVMQGELVSPSGRFEFELDVREVFNSHWAATPTLVDGADRSAVFAFANDKWSCDQARWDGERVTLWLRKYPGNHTPAGIRATIDCLEKTGAVGDGPHAPLAGLEAALDAALTFQWGEGAGQPAAEPPEPAAATPLGQIEGGG